MSMFNAIVNFFLFVGLFAVSVYLIRRANARARAAEATARSFEAQTKAARAEADGLRDGLARARSDAHRFAVEAHQATMAARGLAPDGLPLPSLPKLPGFDEPEGRADKTQIGFGPGTPTRIARPVKKVS